MSEPLAYFLTFGTYGAWLHGDTRGSKDLRHNTLGEMPLTRDDFRRQRELRSLAHESQRISPAMRLVIESALRAACAARGWALLELNVRTEHIHAVVSGTVKPETILTALKAAATRDLRAAGLLAPEAKLWARHGSTRYLWSEDDVLAAREYVLDHQGTDLPGSQWRKWRDAYCVRASD